MASFSGGQIMVVKITPNDKGNPVGKLADAELHFSDGALEGLTSPAPLPVRRPNRAACCCSAWEPSC